MTIALPPLATETPLAAATPARGRRPRQQPPFPLPAPEAHEPPPSRQPARQPSRPDEPLPELTLPLPAPLPPPRLLAEAPPPPAQQPEPVGRDMPSAAGEPLVALAPAAAEPGPATPIRLPAAALTDLRAAPPVPSTPESRPAALPPSAREAETMTPPVAPPPPPASPAPPAPPPRTAHPAAVTPPPIAVAISSDAQGSRNPGTGASPSRPAPAPAAPAAMPFGLEGGPPPEAPPEQAAPLPPALPPRPAPAVPTGETAVRIGIDRDDRLDVTIAAATREAAQRLEAATGDLARDLAALGSEVEAIRVEIRADAGPDAGADGGRPDPGDASPAAGDADRREHAASGNQTKGDPMPNRNQPRRDVPPPSAVLAPQADPARPSRVDRYA